MLGGIFEGLDRIATLAPMVEEWLAGTVHQLLLGESVQNAISNLISGFHGTYSRECPVGPAPSLVLDRRDRIILSPIHRSRDLEVTSSIRLVRG